MVMLFQWKSSTAFVWSISYAIPFSHECFFSCSIYKHLSVILRDFTSGYFYEIEKKAFFYFKLFCRLLDCFAAKYVEKCLLLILRF